ncbi:MAG: SRPBCC family protein [Nocardioidaceae bacterium]
MSADELVYTRTVSAPRPFVFACLTEPRHLAAFWGPAGTTTPLDRIIVEARPGGRFETLIINDADGSTHHMQAVFDKVDPQHTLSWTETDTGMTTTMTFTDADTDRTEIRIHQHHVPDALRRPDAQNGFQSSLDRFEDYLHTSDQKDT